MLNRRQILLRGSALAGAAAIASVPFARPAHAGDNAEVIAWFKDNALPLATAEPGSSFDDLAPFRAMIGNARVLSLGEATHGTREFFQLKHRLIEYCVTKLNFNIIAFEAEFGAMLAVNDYVLDGKGRAADVIAGTGFWPWDTEEVIALIEWVRAWNLAHDRKVKFYGFDVQHSIGAASRLLAYLERVAPELAAACEQDLAPLSSYCSIGDLAHLSASVRQQLLARTKGLLEAFNTERARWVAQSSELEWRLARQCAFTIEQWTLMMLDGAVDSDDRRELAQAANVLALLEAEGPRAKAILWAHNGHVQRTPWFGSNTMGGHLHAVLGAKQVVVGFAYNQGSFRSRGVFDGEVKLGTHTVGPAPDGFLDAALAATGLPLFVVDLTEVPLLGPVDDWMASKPLQRWAGSIFTPYYEKLYAKADPREAFDVLIFVETMTAARGNDYDISMPGMVTQSNEQPNLVLANGNAISAGWHATSASVQPYHAAITDESSPQGARAVRIARADMALNTGDGALTQNFDAASWRGKRLVFSAAMRADAPHIGTGAHMIVNVWPKRPEGSNPPAMRPMLAMQSEGSVRSSAWTRRSIAVDIPAEAERIQISLVVTGARAGWFGDLDLATASATH